MADTAIFDVDGTLVDTNYHHALAWFRACPAPTQCAHLDVWRPALVPFPRDQAGTCGRG